MLARERRRDDIKRYGTAIGMRTCFSARPRSRRGTSRPSPGDPGPRGKHSEKPAEFYDIIETIYTHGRRLEMYARRQRQGWDVYGHVAELEAAYGEGELPRPDFWGGFRVIPEVVEFWQGRANRLHDRLRYRKDESVALQGRLDRP